jgi:amino acid permease
MAPQSGLVSTALVLLTSGIGTGVLVLPYAMKSVGYVVLMALLFGGSLVSFFTTLVLFIAATSDAAPRTDIELALTKGTAQGTGHSETLEARSETYSGLVVKNSAPSVGVVLDSVFIFHGLGTAVGYFIFLAGFLTTFPFWPIKDTKTTIFILAAAEFPCILGRTASILSKLGSFSVTAMVMLIIGIMFRAPELAEARTTPIDAVAEGWLGKIPETLCIAVFAFQWQNTSVHAANLLRDPTPRRCAICIGGATTLLLGIYAVVAGSAYVSFGRSTEGNIVLMYPEEDPIFVVIRGCLILSVGACRCKHVPRAGCDHCALGSGEHFHEPRPRRWNVAYADVHVSDRRAECHGGRVHPWWNRLHCDDVNISVSRSEAGRVADSMDVDRGFGYAVYHLHRALGLTPRRGLRLRTACEIWLI